MIKATSLEICSGAGGQALGLEMAGFAHAGLVEIDSAACATLKGNRPKWNVYETDLRSFSSRDFKGVDLVAGGVPCPPFSKAGKQLGADDERDLFPEAVRLVAECKPKAVMLENVRGLLDPVFKEYREKLEQKMLKLGYLSDWKLLNASDYGVSQLRPRVIFVALKKQYASKFRWPDPANREPLSVGELLTDLMSERNWKGVRQWARNANAIAPTLVGGSKKHGGPDLGPTRAKKAWAQLQVDGHGLADSAPEREFVGLPRLTTRMAARVQGFPDSWMFSGKKTAAYRQIGNAFPPPVARAVGREILRAIGGSAKTRAT